MTLQKAYLKSASSTDTQKPKTAQIRIKNPIQSDVYVNAIELTLDSYFNVKGIAEIKIGDTVILDPTDAGDFRKYKLFQIPLDGMILPRNKFIEIYIWNGTDTDEVSLSANIIVSEKPKIISLSGVPSSLEQINNEISGGSGDEMDSNVLFPSRLYSNGTYEKLINTNGRKNMFLTMSASTIIPPILLNNSFPVDNPPDSLELQRIQSYYNYVGVGHNTQMYVIRCDNVPETITPYTTQHALIDYINTNPKNIIFTLMSLTPSDVKYQYTFWHLIISDGRNSTYYYTTIEFSIINSIKHIVETSDDIDFVNDVIQIDEYDFLGIQYTKQYSNIQKRYVRIREIITPSYPSNNDQTINPVTPNITLNHTPTSNSFTILDYYDELSHGGTASLRLEIKGLDGEWFTTIPAAELGAITQGQKKLIEFNSSVTTHIIPSSQDSFRAVMEITGGQLDTGVSIIMVA